MRSISDTGAGTSTLDVYIATFNVAIQGFGNPATTTFGTVVVGTAWYFSTSLFYESSPQEHKDRVEAFFKNLQTPVDKQGVEDLQTAIYHLLGLLCMVIWGSHPSAHVHPQQLWRTNVFLFCGGVIFLAGTILFAIYKRRQKLQPSPEVGGSSSPDPRA